jgi:hypothetical protein
LLFFVIGSPPAAFLTIKAKRIQGKTKSKTTMSHHYSAAAADPQKSDDEESSAMTTTVTAVARVARRRLLMSLASLLVGTTLLCASRRVASAATLPQEPSTSRAASSSLFWSGLSWHIKPIKPHHHGDVIFLTEKVDGTDHYKYKREFTVPCGYGILVFNIGPALENQPYSYDIYQDNYAYSDNSGLCVIYPSYKGEQEADFPLWEPSDPTQMTIALGDTPTKISTRVVAPNYSKPFDASKKGGDFCIMRSGNFYNPDYYKHLKHEINTWPQNMMAQEGDTIEHALADAVQRVDAQMQLLATTNHIHHPTTTATTTTASGVRGGGASQY